MKKNHVDTNIVITDHMGWQNWHPTSTTYHSVPSAILKQVQLMQRSQILSIRTERKIIQFMVILFVDLRPAREYFVHIEVEII